MRAYLKGGSILRFFDLITMQLSERSSLCVHCHFELVI